MKKHFNIVAAFSVICLCLLSEPAGLYATTVDSLDGSGNETQSTARLSADNSLKELSLSSGSLSPAFYYSTTKYTASVPNDVTSVTVNAKVSNSKAVIESITGYENLVVGENTIKVIVVAENGEKAIYTIVVTRLAEGASTPQSNSTASNQEESVGEDEPTADNEQNGNTENTDGNQQQDSFILNLGDRFLIAVGDSYFIPTEAPAEMVPDYITPVELQLNDEVTLPAFQYIDAEGSVPVLETDFYLIFGLGDDGAYGWYQYDRKDRSVQRYIERAVAQSTDADTLALQQSVILYANQAEQLSQKIRLMTYVFLFIVVILLIIMFSVLWSRRDRDYEDDIFDDADDRTDEETIKKEEKEEKELSLIIEPRKTVQLDEANLDSSQEDEEEPDNYEQRSPKKIKRKDSLLAYLGLDDDLPLDYGEEIDDEADIDNTGMQEKKKADLKLEKKKRKHSDEEEDNSENDDIEFIDLN